MSDVTYPVLDNTIFKRLVDMGDGTHAEINVAHFDESVTFPNTMAVTFPPDLLTDPDDHDQDRLKVENASTGFFDGREFRVSYEYTGTTAYTWVKLTSTVDFILKDQSFSCDQGGLRFVAYRSSQGSESGTFGTPIILRRNNFMSTAEQPTQNLTMNIGGTFTPTVGEVPTEVVRLMCNTGGNGPTAGSRNTVGGQAGGQRGLPAGSYYLGFGRLTGTTVDALGVWSWIAEQHE